MTDDRRALAERLEKYANEFYTGELNESLLQAAALLREAAAALQPQQTGHRVKDWDIPPHLRNEPGKADEGMPLDLTHTPADYEEAVEMLQRARARLASALEQRDELRKERLLARSVAYRAGFEGGDLAEIIGVIHQRAEAAEREAQVRKQLWERAEAANRALQEKLVAAYGALSKSVESIRAWHGMGVSEKQERELWEIYWNIAPEMKPLRELLAARQSDHREGGGG